MRDFNRYYTLRLGVLTDRYLGQDRPFGQARLLFEIGDGSDLGELCTRLDLGATYLNDMMRTLERQGLVRVRDRVARLTDAGRRERADLEDRSNAGIAALLGELTTGQRERLIAAQDEI